MKLLTANIQANYSISLELEVREDLTDQEIGQQLVSQFITKTMPRREFILTPFSDVKGDGVRKVKVVIALPNKLNEYINFVAFVYLLSGRVKSSMALDYKAISSDFWSAFNSTKPLFNTIDNDRLVDFGSKTTEELNDCLVKCLSFYNQPGIFRISNYDGIMKLEMDNPASISFYNFYPGFRDLREVMLTLLVNINL